MINLPSIDLYSALLVCFRCLCAPSIAESFVKIIEISHSLLEIRHCHFLLFHKPSPIHWSALAQWLSFPLHQIMVWGTFQVHPWWWIRQSLTCLILNRRILLIRRPPNSRKRPFGRFLKQYFARVIGRFYRPVKMITPLKLICIILPIRKSIVTIIHNNFIVGRKLYIFFYHIYHHLRWYLCVLFLDIFSAKIIQSQHWRVFHLADRLHLVPWLARFRYDADCF